MATFTYTIFDSDPNECGACTWPHKEHIKIEADSMSEAIGKVRDILETEAFGLSESDYSVGDKIYANVYGDRTKTISYEITEEDLA